MNLAKIHSVYFLGIGGIGMSAIARYLLSLGKKVYGYDLTPTALTDALVSEGMVIHFEDNINMIPSSVIEDKEHVLIIYTPAIPKTHKEYNYLISKGHKLFKRSQVLGMITKQTFTVGVAGTHGKTTISSMITHILKTAGLDFNAFLGGIPTNYNTNFIASKENKITVVEADEFDRSFLTLHPDIAVISSIDADHLDIYGDHNEVKKSFTAYAGQIKDGGTLVHNNRFKLEGIEARSIAYSVTDAVESRVENITIKGDTYNYDIVIGKDRIENCELPASGLHNVENSVAAATVATLMGVSADSIRKALATFLGVKRRFEYHIKTDDLVYIDDYAHHPTELEALITSVKKMYPEKKILGIFQPHLFSRTSDFADGFAKSLDNLDEVMLLDIYPARELPVKGITSEILIDRMQIRNKAIVAKEDIISELLKKDLEVVLTIGAGDIDKLVLPIKEALLNIKITN